MIRQQARGRAGITLTEILIAIMILGVGMIALVTLFPIGLLRMRAATRMTRSALLFETAASELETRNLLSANSFINGLSGKYTVSPWVGDGAIGGATVYRGVTNSGLPGPGLPVAYDPLWCAQTGVFPPTGTASGSLGRFGDGASPGYLRNDPLTGSRHYAWGLQRVSNFNPGLYSAGGGVTAAVSAGYQYNIVSNIFVSQEDVVWNSENDKATAAAGVLASPVLPDLYMGGSTSGFPTLDWRYTWFFTGTQSDADDATMFDGNVVICENRQFSVDTNTGQVTGETVVEAIFGFANSASANAYYGFNASRTVLLRWPATMPDPEVKVGDWIADVTYEVNLADDLTIRTAQTKVGSVYPNQRCFWYQVAKKTAPDTDVSPGAPAGYRSMTVWVSTPLQAYTMLLGGQAQSLNVALIMPSVVNVFPRTVYSR